MKNILYLMLSMILVASVMSSCTKDNKDSSIANVDIDKRYLENVEYLRPKLRFKHSGCSTCGCNAGTCECPLGICIIWRWSQGALTTDEIEQGVGYADVGIVDSETMHMVFLQPVALPDSTIVIDEDYYIGPEGSEMFGSDSLTIKAGVYEVDFSDSENGYGEAYFIMSSY